MRLVMIFIVFVTLQNSIYGARTKFEEKSQMRQKLYHREKRWLVFPPNGGTAKYVAGYLGPIDTPKFINCNAIRNFQYQYDLPASLRKVYEVKASWTRPKSRSLENKEKIMPDSTRKIAYELIEDILTRDGKNGHECLLRTICEVAETPLHHNGFVGELLDVFFTPGEHEVIHGDYRDARKAGLNHVDCIKMYPSCSFGDGILDTFSIIRDYKFENILYY